MRNLQLLKLRSLRLRLSYRPDLAEGRPQKGLRAMILNSLHVPRAGNFSKFGVSVVVIVIPSLPPCPKASAARQDPTLEMVPRLVWGSVCWRETVSLQS